jgi:2-dehydro-3-deoxygalactonokinase
MRIDAGSQALRGRSLRIVPGLIDRSSSRVADVMRGEETQIAGLLHARAGDAANVCLPGTHSKWVGLREGTITSIGTAMTGEVYALLRRHSILARLMDAVEPPTDAASFDLGVQRSRDGGGLLHHIFGVRAQGLLGELSATQAPSYLSGLLIGHEIRSQPPVERKVHVIAAERLAALYARALAACGIESEVHSEQLAATGMFVLAQTA